MYIFMMKQINEENNFLATFDLLICLISVISQFTDTDTDYYITIYMAKCKITYTVHDKRFYP